MVVQRDMRKRLGYEASAVLLVLPRKQRIKILNKSFTSEEEFEGGC